MGQWECNPRWYKCKFVSKELHKTRESYTSAERGGHYDRSDKIEDSSDDEEDVMVVDEPNLRTLVVGTGLYLDNGDYFDLDSLDTQSCSVIDDDDDSEDFKIAFISIQEPSKSIEGDATAKGTINGTLYIC
jgi:hypothetical protein